MAHFFSIGPVFREQITPKALNILDRYHVMAMMNKKVDKVRAEETRQLKQEGYEPILKHSRRCLLKRPSNRTSKQTAKLRELLKYNLRTMRAYLMKEDFQRFWSYRSASCAGKFLDAWCTRAMRSQPISSLDGVKQMDKFDDSYAIAIIDTDGTLALKTIELP